jgi:hypothetical protein
MSGEFVRTRNSLPIGLEHPFRGCNGAIGHLYPASDEDSHDLHANENALVYYSAGHSICASARIR